MAIVFEKGEKIIHQSRKHWIIFAVEVVTLLIMLFAPLVLISAFQAFPVVLNSSGNTFVLFSFIYMLWVFMIWNFLFILWTDYYLDLLVVTNKRVIDIDQKGLFRREVSILRLSEIQDVTTDINGIIATFFHFGNIHVQTAGQKREFTINHLNDPSTARRAINDAIDNYRKEEYRIK